MAEEVKNVTDVQVKDTVEKIKTLQGARKELESLKDELDAREKDLVDAGTVYGTDSKEYGKQKEYVELTKGKIAEAEKKVADLTFKQSELKPVLDELTKTFETAYKAATSKDYHIEIATVEKDADGNAVPEAGKGRKVFKQLLEYLYKNVKFTPKTAASLMVLVRNMEENKAWVSSKDFDNVIILRSASVLSLWRFIMDNMEGCGFYEARTFLNCWAECGQSVSDAIRLIQKENEDSRAIAGDLNLVEDEFNRSENDLPEDAPLTTQEEVAPEVTE